MSDKPTGKIFMNGRSQAVRIPKALRLDADEVIFEKTDRGLHMIPKPRSWADYFSNRVPIDDASFAAPADEPFEDEVFF